MSISDQEKGGLVDLDDRPEANEVVERPYTIRDESDSNSLIQYLSPRLREEVMALPEFLLDISEASLKARCKPTPTDYSLRVSFWREFERTMWRGKGRITSAQIYAGICSDVYFYRSFLKNKVKLAWMVRPIQVYQKEMEAVLHRCTERLWDLVNIEFINPKTKKVDPKLADIVLKTVAQVENRVHGMAVQRTEARSMNVNVVTRSKANQNIETMDELDARIKQIEAEIQGEIEEEEPKPCVPILEPAQKNHVIDAELKRANDKKDSIQVTLPGYQVSVT